MGKAAYIIGGLFGLAGLAFIVSRVTAGRLEGKAEVTLAANPINAVVLVDDKYEVATPIKLYLTPGIHKFAAPPKTSGLQITFLFDRWELNGQPVSYSNPAVIQISEKSTLVAQYTLAEAGIYPILPTPV